MSNIHVNTKGMSLSSTWFTHRFECLNVDVLLACNMGATVVSVLSH